MNTKDEVRQLVDRLSDDYVDAVHGLLRRAVDGDLPVDRIRTLAQPINVALDNSWRGGPPIRSFSSAGALSAEPDLAERVEEILRTEG